MGLMGLSCYINSTTRLPSYPPKGCPMSRLLLALTALGGLFAVAAAASEPFAIDLEVRCGKASKTAHAESAAPGAKPSERAILEINAGDKITVHWKLQGADAKAKIEDVTVHFVAVKEEQANQPPPHKLVKGVVAESALIMDVGPKETNESQLSFNIDKPGYYLIRVETLDAAAGGASHDDFAVLDVKVR
jgi:hypothetical protein